MGYPHPMGTLYVVTTPIGNLEDLTLRAIRVLSEVGLVAAEDTRQSRKLLTHLGLSKRMVSYNQHNAASRAPRLLRSLLKEDVALVTDAGVPAISDPGAELVRQAAEQGTDVIAIPGPSAVTTALSVSGMGGDSFRFVGFSPRARKQRLELLRGLEAEPSTLVFFESPHRIRALLEDLVTVLGERAIAVCRELTKLHEEVFRGTPADALAHFDNPRGEFVVVAHGAPPRKEVEADEEGARTALAALKAQGQTRRDAVAQVVDAFAVSKREAYKLWLAG
jgi:16S rRNA (cytidine1402-2'-O)-methyltransferase